MPDRPELEIIAGRNPVVEALKAGRPLNKIWLARNIGSHAVIGEILRLSRERGIPIEYVPREVIDRLGTAVNHQGVVAQASVKEYIDLDDLLALSTEKKEPPLYCILNGVEDPRNLGAIIRTAEASGCHGIIIPPRRAAGLTPVVARASAGAVEYLPVARVTNISQSIETLKKNGVWIVGLDLTGQLDYTGVDMRTATAIVIGGEDKGLSELVRKHCDYLVRIPMMGKITSLNTSVAAALVMYEARRQRGWQ
jgi:23S rRNA (guanosine2251-2'-O)-methyltransferase